MMYLGAFLLIFGAIIGTLSHGRNAWFPAMVLVGVLVLLGIVGPAHGAVRAQEAKLSRCFVYVPAIKDPKFRRWCMRQSARMP